MLAYQVVRRDRKYRIRRIHVLGKTPTGFRVAGPVALWPSDRNTFRRRRDAEAYLASVQRRLHAKTPSGEAKRNSCTEENDSGAGESSRNQQAPLQNSRHFLIYLAAGEDTFRQPATGQTT